MRKPSFTESVCRGMDFISGKIEADDVSEWVTGFEDGPYDEKQTRLLKDVANALNWIDLMIDYRVRKKHLGD